MRKEEDLQLVGIMSVVHEGRPPFGMQTYFFEDMVRYSELEDEAMFFFSPLDWQENEKVTKGFSFVDGVWVEKRYPLPRIIYDRAFSRDKDQKLRIEEVRTYLDASAFHILNPLGLAELLNDKVSFHSFLIKEGVSTLDAIPWQDLDSKHFRSKLDSSRLFLKPTFGSKGEGIYTIEKAGKLYILKDYVGTLVHFEEFDALYAHLQSIPDMDVDYFVQEAAQIVNYEDSPFDIRVLVQNYGAAYSVTGEAVRIGQKDHITSNLNSGGTAIPLGEISDFLRSEYGLEVEEVRKLMESLCMDCAEVLRSRFGEFCEIGFDILLTKDKGPIILEANAKPSRWVFVKMADYLEGIGKDKSYYLNRRRETVSVPMKYASYVLSRIDE